MKKALSLILAVLMLFGCMSVTVFAYENVRGDESTINSLTLAVGDVIPVTKDLRDEEDKVTNLKFYNLDPTWAYGDTERVFTGSVPDSYCISLEYPSCPSTGVLLVTKAWDETDKTIELAFYASEEDIPAAPSGKSGNTDITLTVAKSLTYDMVIPEDVTNLNAAGIYSVGQAKVQNVKNATEKTVISYTATTTNFTSEGKAAIPASYYTDAQGTAFPTTAVEVYKNKKDAENIPTMYVGISEANWNAAENGTYKATVTFNFSAEEVEKVTIADILPEEFPTSAMSSAWVNDASCHLFVSEGNLFASGDAETSVPVATVLTPTSGNYDYTCTVSDITWNFSVEENGFWLVKISGFTDRDDELNGIYGIPR